MGSVLDTDVEASRRTYVYVFRVNKSLQIHVSDERISRV